MLDFKSCKYYKNALEQEHCAFETICSDECYFSNAKVRKDLNEVLSDYKEIEQELSLQEDAKQERDSIQEELNCKQNEFDSLFELLSLVLAKFKDNDINLKSEIDDYDFDYTYKRKVLEMIEGLDNYKVSAEPTIKNLEIVCEDSKYLPTYANDTDACMDLKIKVNAMADSDHPNSYDYLEPGESKVFPTGVKMKIPDGFFVQVFPRSSTGFKLNCMLANTVGIIDTGFRDELKLKIHNFGKERVVLEDGQRVAQFILLPRPKINLIRVEDNEEFRNGDRGGGFGSTGK